MIGVHYWIFCLYFRYEIKDDIPIETKLDDKLVLAEASASLTPSNKEEANKDSADTDSAVARQNQLNEKQAQGNNESYRLDVV